MEAPAPPPTSLEGEAAPAGPPGRLFDVSRDGRSFLVVKPESREQIGDAAPMVLVLNWVEELKAKLPAR